MKIEVIKELTNKFESIFHKADNVEFWFARELQELLGYSQWRNFQPVIEKAKIACRNAGQDVDDHFAGVRKMVSIGSETQREVEDIMLTEQLPAETDTKKLKRKIESDSRNLLKGSKGLKEISESKDDNTN